jgi:CubicO group peptidase (beta-lactamase class C family)
MEMLSHNRTITIFFVVICLLIGFNSERSFAGQVNQKYWPTKKWITSTPESQNMDSNQLEKMNNYFENNCPLLRSAIIVRGGNIVFEKYYKGESNSIQPMYSVTKSIISALIGIALDKGYINNIDQKMVTFFPEYASEITDSRFNEITIQHLLTMTAGFTTNYRGSNGMKGCFEEIIIAQPGSHASYNSSSSHLLSGIISKSTKMSTLEFAYQQLFKPLGIRKPDWHTGIDGYNMGGKGLWMGSIDMAKIGYLYLQNGVWDNNQIISSEWIKTSTKEKSAIKLGQKEYSYGYLWWVESFESHSFFSAFGYGGQYIEIIPDLDIVIVTTSDSRTMGPKHRGVAMRYVIRSIMK